MNPLKPESTGTQISVPLTSLGKSKGSNVRKSQASSVATCFYLRKSGLFSGANCAVSFRECIGRKTSERKQKQLEAASDEKSRFRCARL